MKNPFKFGREIGPSDLVNRQEEVRLVVNAIREGSKLFLIGPRRYGKTSILRAASENAEHEGMVVLRYDVEAYPSLDLLARAMLAEATGRLSGQVEKAGEKIKKFFGKLKPEVSYTAHRHNLSFLSGGKPRAPSYFSARHFSAGRKVSQKNGGQKNAQIATVRSIQPD